MPKYYGVFECGHEGSVNVSGPAKQRKYKLSYAFARLCPECYTAKKLKERTRKFEYAKQIEKENEYPGIEGTIKQIEWATVVRQEVLDKIYSIVSKNIQELNAVEYGIKKNTSAKFWIENSSETILSIFIKEYKEFNSIPEDIRKDIEYEKLSLTTVPKNSKFIKPDIVYISASQDKKWLELRYIKDWDYISLVKNKGFRWSGEAFSREITEYTGSLDDRAAEIAHTLLSNGYTVQFMNTHQQKKAINVLFEPECHRWIKFNAEHNSLVIQWKGLNNTLYNLAQKIPSFRYKNKSIHVNLAEYKQVLDFAKTMNFKISKTALTMISKQQESEKKYLYTDINKISEDNSIDDLSLLKQKLQSDGTIIEDLKDD